MINSFYDEDDDDALLFDAKLRYCAFCGSARDWQPRLVFHRYGGAGWCHVAGNVPGTSAIIAWIGWVSVDGESGQRIGKRISKRIRDDARRAEIVK